MPNRFIRKQAAKQGRKHGIPPKVLMGLMEQESGFNPGAVSSAGARGLTQFIPSTAKSYGVKYGTSKKAQRTQIRGAAKYLSDLGFKQDKKTALGRYYGSTASPYASQVLAKSKKYKGTAKLAGGRTRPGQKTMNVKFGKRKRELVSPPQNRSHERRLARLEFVRQENKSPLDYAAFQEQMKSLKDVPARYAKGQPSIRRASVSRAKGKGGAVKGKGAGGLMGAAKLAQQMGLHVGEHPKFGGVAAVHATNSHHYSGNAIDVSGDIERLKKFARKVDKLYGRKLAELFWNGPGAVNRDNGRRVGKGYVSGHTGHVHVAIT